MNKIAITVLLLELACPELFKNKDKDFSSELELLDDDAQDDEGCCHFSLLILMNRYVLGTKNVTGADTDALTGFLLDEFSSTQNSEKKKPMNVKVEKKIDEVD
nr:hypothetical protein Iba_chr07fCG4600 [Ipomoea batatas]